MAEDVVVTGLVVEKAVVDEDGGAGPFEVVDTVLIGAVVCVFVLPWPAYSKNPVNPNASTRTITPDSRTYSLVRFCPYEGPKS